MEYLLGLLGLNLLGRLLKQANVPRLNPESLLDFKEVETLSSER